MRLAFAVLLVAFPLIPARAQNWWCPAAGAYYPQARFCRNGTWVWVGPATSAPLPSKPAEGGQARVDGPPQLSSTPTTASIGTMTIGPSFDCSKVHQPLALMICASPGVSRTDLRFNQAYQALRYQLDEAGRRHLREEDLKFLASVRQRCAIPETGPVSGSPECVAAQYERQRSIWMARLSGPAAEEATRSIEQQIALQARLQKLGFLASDVKIDGVYSGATRSAILAWQKANDRPEIGFLSDADAATLAATPAATTEPPPPERAQTTPIASPPSPATPAPPPSADEGGTSASLSSGLPVLVIGSLVVIVAILTLVYRKYRKKILTQRVLKAVYATTYQHKRALVRRRFQTLRHDDYNNTIEVEWQKELNYFLEKVLDPAIRQLGVAEYALYGNMRPTLLFAIKDLIGQQADSSESFTLGPNLTPADYEQYCAQQLRSAGWSANTTKASGDQGSDIIAQKGDTRLVVQCKLYNHPVGNKAVQEVAAARAHEQADWAAVVSNSRYTYSAQQLAETNRILLLHHADLENIDALLST